MDVIIKTEPPDDEYMQAPSVPDDSQWQKKRSKLHNLLFGSHGNASPRDRTPEHRHGNASSCDRTPEPNHQTDIEGFALVSHGNGPEVERGRTIEAGKNQHKMGENGMSGETMKDAGIVVKMENIEADVASSFDRGDSIPVKDPFQHRNGSPQLTNNSSESSSLLKSMLTCPISNIEGPSLDSFRISLNDNPTGRQDNFSELRQMLQEKPEIPSEIRKMPVGPSKSGAMKSISESSPAISLALSSSVSIAKSNPILSNSLFSTSDNSMATTSASALLKQLSVRSRQTPKENNPSPSFPRSMNSEQLKNETVSRHNSRTTLEKPIKSKNPKQTIVEQERIANSAKGSPDTAQHIEDDENKAKAIEEAVGSFSKFLQSSMSKHDFSAEQMKFIMASAMQSASKVILEAAEKSNATDTMKETAASFIENAIGDAIRSETSKKLANKTATASNMPLKGLLSEKSDRVKESVCTSLNTKQSSGKLSSKSSTKRKSENQSDTKSGGTNLGENKKKKQKVQENLEKTVVETDSQRENGLDRDDSHTTDIPIVMVKEEPIEYPDNYSENMNFQDGRIDQTDFAKNSNSSKVENVRSVYTRILDPRTIVEDSLMRNALPGNVSIKTEPVEVLDNHGESEVYKHIAGPDEKADFNETRTTNTASVIDSLKDQNPKSFKKPLGVEMKYRCQFCSLTFPNAVFLVKHIQKRHSDENTGIEDDDDDPLKAALEQARNSKPVLVSLLSSFKCRVCGLSFEHKGSLRVHERGHTTDSDKVCQCNLCGKIVSDESYLKLHMYTHKDTDFPKGKEYASYNEACVPTVHAKEADVLKRGMYLQDIETLDNKDMVGNESLNVTAVEIYNLKTIKTEPADMNDETPMFESKDKHMYLWSNADNLKDESHGIESEITSGSTEKDTLNEDSEKDMGSLGKEKSINHSPDMSLVKVEPQCVEENTNIERTKAAHDSESFEKDSVGDNLIKKLLVTSFLDQEIEKTLKQNYGKDRQSKSIPDLDDTRKAESPTSYKCGICGLEFEHRGTLKVHQRGHNAKKSCKCPICGKSVTDTSYLKIHMRTHEPEINIQNPNHENWETAENRNKNSLRCETCKLQFSSHGHFEIHQRIHKGEKPFKCEECGAGFVNKNQLQSHQGIHTNLKPFKCSKCSMCFRQNSGLRLHLLVHEEEKPKKCPFCDASFSRKAHLDKHIRYHSGERPFSCEVCSKSFVDKELLKQHTKKVHADGNVGKRGPYKERLYPGGIREQLGPHWKGFQAVYDPSDRMEILKSSYPCGVCGETYDEITLLVEHLETHNKPKDEEDESDMITEEQFSNMINDDNVGNMKNDNVGNKLTDYTIRGLLNSNSSSGVPTTPGLGLSGLNVEKLFKCPFCQESFDLPGPRIRHVHEAHPINKDTLVVLDKEDPDYFLKQHLLEDRTTVETLYGKTATTLPLPNTPDIKPSLSSSTNTNAKSISELLNSNLNQLNPNVNQLGSYSKSSSQSSMNSSLNVFSTTKSNAISETKIPKTEPVDHDMIRIETNDKTSNTPQSKDLIKLPCPYCDRIYQRQSSRTRHINENHRDKSKAFKLIKEIRDRQKFIVE